MREEISKSGILHHENSRFVFPGFMNLLLGLRILFLSLVDCPQLCILLNLLQFLPSRMASPFLSSYNPLNNIFSATVPPKYSTSGKTRLQSAQLEAAVHFPRGNLLNLPAIRCQYPSHKPSIALATIPINPIAQLSFSGFHSLSLFLPHFSSRPILF